MQLRNRSRDISRTKVPHNISTKNEEIKEATDQDAGARKNSRKHRVGCCTPPSLETGRRPAILI